ncbi:Chromodomain-helicase-DNA-binding protein 1-like [Sciurus carolinensis]|uniref:Chromodomain-helicase-DNA-binding protein 1-like n=1 Tax=Sciurus carolinensis TaxID=30640 RepID=A0AA41T679_SCICA|nr:Chromodomain-helicase-DNA-binding protein 1-like [Sciurus carolinensis]
MLCPYQLEGVNWLAQHFLCQNGCILGDEMGLAKTCQMIALIIYLAGRINDEGPFLTLCPLSCFEQVERRGRNVQSRYSWTCYNYELVDGSVSGEERHLAIKNFGQQPSFICLLNTRADTVEEVVYRKAASKLQLNNMIIEGGHFTLGSQKPLADADLQVKYVILFFKVP